MAGSRAHDKMSAALLAADDLLSDLAVDLVAAAGKARHVSPQYLAIAVPGLCHAHNPCSSARPASCAYCARRGNCFDEPPAGGASRPGGQVPPPDPGPVGDVR
jgi:hypothetical protein